MYSSLIETSSEKMNVQKFSLTIHDKADRTSPFKRFGNADSQRLIAFAIAPGFQLIRNLEADIWPRLLQANKCRISTFLIWEDSVCIAGVNLLNKRLPEIVVGCGFGEFLRFFVHKLGKSPPLSPNYIIYTTNKLKNYFSGSKSNAAERSFSCSSRYFFGTLISEVSSSNVPNS